LSSGLVLATTLAVRGATLIDGTGAPPVPNSLLVVFDGKIVSVGAATPEALKALPAAAQIVSAEGKWIIPGLIDAHVHAESEEDLKAMLRWGVTSVRLMAEDVAAAEKLAKASGARADIPEIFPAAPIFTVRGGWWDQGQPGDANLNRFPATPEEARASVRRAKELGSREIKVMLDDMSWCRAPLSPFLKVPPEVAAALLSEARALGLRAIVHAPILADARAAIADGATALAHGVLNPIDEATVAIMKSRPVFYIPTMDIFEFLADTRGFVDFVLGDPATRAPGRGLSPETVQRYRSAEYADDYRERYPNFDSLNRRMPTLVENLGRLYRAGVPIALGTDMWAFPGLGVSIEMALYVEAGISPLETVRAATQTSARSLGIDGDRGTLEAGKRADFVVLSADPLLKVRNVRQIVEIYKRGRAVGGSAP
jgi:imidazolonepropionase-like amidohydrolase